MAMLDTLSAAGDPGLCLLWAASQALAAQSPLNLADAVGGALLEEEPPLAMSEGALQRALQRIATLDSVDERIIQAAGHAARGLKELADLPDPVREAAFEAMDNGRRWAFAGRGLRRLALSVASARQVELLRIEPGCGAPRHDHAGDEFTLVLRGAFHDGHALYRRGEISIGHAGFVHKPVAQPGEVCFALAVSEGDPKFEGMLGFVQQLTRH